MDIIRTTAFLLGVTTGAVMAQPSDNGSHLEGVLSTSYRNAAYQMIPHITYQNALSTHWNLRLRAFLKEVDLMALLGYSTRINPTVVVTPSVGLSYGVFHASQSSGKRYVAPTFSLQVDTALSEAWSFITTLRYANGPDSKKGYEGVFKLYYALLDGIGVQVGYRGRKMGSVLHHGAEVGVRLYM